jgi:hypothetical protein
LDDVNLAFHVGPFDVLVAAAKDALDLVCGSHQAANHFVRQNGALSRDGNLFDAALLVESQEAVFGRAR